MTEWTLSDRMMSKFSNANKMDYYFFYDKDVKEFIRRLKELSIIMTEPDEEGFHIMQIPVELFDKLAGEKLV